MLKIIERGAAELGKIDDSVYAREAKSAAIGAETKLAGSHNAAARNRCHDGPKKTRPQEVTNKRQISWQTRIPSDEQIQ